MKNFRMADWINILESRRYGLVTRRKGRELMGCAAHPGFAAFGLLMHDLQSLRGPALAHPSEAPRSYLVGNFYYWCSCRMCCLGECSRSVQRSLSSFAGSRDPLPIMTKVQGQLYVYRASYNSDLHFHSARSIDRPASKGCIGGAGCPTSRMRRQAE
jgi:hypothetical protein